MPKMKKREAFPPMWKPTAAGESISAIVLRVDDGGDYGNRFTVKLLDDSDITVKSSDGVVEKKHMEKGSVITLANHSSLMGALEPADAPPVTEGWYIDATCTGVKPARTAGYHDLVLYSVSVGEPDKQSTF